MSRRFYQAIANEVIISNSYQKTSCSQFNPVSDTVHMFKRKLAKSKFESTTLKSIFMHKNKHKNGFLLLL